MLRQALRTSSFVSFRKGFTQRTRVRFVGAKLLLNLAWVKVPEITLFETKKFVFAVFCSFKWSRGGQEARLVSEIRQLSIGA